jgi:translation initiation factor eIF-2B subunit delta
VREALLANPGREALQVMVLESRPMLEGRLLAAALARAGVPVTLAVDAAASTLVRRCSMVLLGADSIGDAGVVNKVGTRTVTSEARAAGVPVLVLADDTKFLPPGFPQRLGGPRPSREVWQAPAGVRIWNEYFEAVPLESMTSVVSELATMTPEDVAEYRGRIRVPEEVRAWAERDR